MEARGPLERLNGPQGLEAAQVGPSGSQEEEALATTFDSGLSATSLLPAAGVVNADISINSAGAPAPLNAQPQNQTLPATSPHTSLSQMLSVCRYYRVAEIVDAISEIERLMGDAPLTRDTGRNPDFGHRGLLPRFTPAASASDHRKSIRLRGCGAGSPCARQ